MVDFVKLTEEARLLRSVSQKINAFHTQKTPINFTDAEIEVAKGDAYRDLRREYDPEKLMEFTCDICTKRKTCPYVYDLYNTEGDCLAEK